MALMATEPSLQPSFLQFVKRAESKAILWDMVTESDGMVEALTLAL